jgi:hypothetical protein
MAEWQESRRRDGRIARYKDGKVLEQQGRRMVGLKIDRIAEGPIKRMVG